MTTIANPEILTLQDGERRFFGGCQDWYETRWQREAGCGPTTCATLLWYLAHTREGCKSLFRAESPTRGEFLKLMEQVWRYVTPGAMGLNSTGKFASGAKAFAAERGALLGADMLDIPQKGERPPYAEVAAFVGGALRADRPVGFLNFSNGALKNLESWHWVTLVGLEGETAFMYDQGERSRLALKTWLETTRWGGGFVALDQADEMK